MQWLAEGPSVEFKDLNPVTRIPDVLASSPTEPVMMLLKLPVPQFLYIYNGCNNSE